MPPRPMSDPQQQGMQQPQWPQRPPNMMGNEGTLFQCGFFFTRFFSRLIFFLFFRWGLF